LQSSRFAVVRIDQSHGDAGRQRLETAILRSLRLGQEPMDRDAEARALGDHRRVADRANSTAEPLPLGGAGVFIDPGQGSGVMEGRVNSPRRTVDDDEVLPAVPRGQSADDASGQLGAVPTSIACDDDAHTYSMAGGAGATKSPQVRLNPGAKMRGGGNEPVVADTTTLVSTFGASYHRGTNRGPLDDILPI
jgi:hypothetical protein